MLGSSLLLTSCGGGKSSSESTVAPGDGATDRDKVVYMAQLNTPDSLARFICYGALGKSADGRIDSLAMAQLYALEIYAADDKKIAEFSRAYDETVERLPLADNYRLAQMTGTLDDTQMPIDLGLRYGARVVREKLPASKVKGDTVALSKLVDPHFFELFRNAFNTAMKN